MEEPETLQAEEVQGLLDVLEPLRRPHRDLVGEYVFFDEPPLGVSSPMENCPDCKTKDKKIADLEISIKCGGTRELKLIGRMDEIQERGIANCYLMDPSIRKIAELWSLPEETIREVLRKRLPEKVS